MVTWGSSILRNPQSDPIPRNFRGLRGSFSSAGEKRTNNEFPNEFAKWMYEFHTFMRLLWEELHDWGWTIQHPDTFIFYILCQQVEKYRFIQLKWVQSSCFQYGNGLRSPMKLRKARHLRRCDRPGRCRPFLTFARALKIASNPSFEKRRSWMGRSLQHVGKGGGAMRWHALMSFVVSMRRDNRNKKMRTSPFFGPALSSPCCSSASSRFHSWGAAVGLSWDWILVQLFSDYRS